MTMSVAEMVLPSPSKATAPVAETTFQVCVQAMRWEAPGVLSVELAATEGDSLPPFEPGAHVDLRLPDGTLRQYSLCGDSTDRSHYRVAIRAVRGGLSSNY